MATSDVPISGLVPQADWTPEQHQAFRDSLRLTFGAKAALYERSRPTFPIEATQWLVGDAARTVADVGAGTGKFTRLLHGAGLDVTAVEPDGGMRAEFAKAVPGVQCVAGSGESIPLPDASLDLVTFAQAWHWVDPVTASREVARVLKPGGRLGLIWNMDVDRPEWMVEALRLEKPYEGVKSDPEVTAPFGELEAQSFDWTETLAPETFLDRVMSRSVYLTLSPEQREHEAELIRAAMREVDEVVTSGVVRLQHRTECFRAQRP